MQRNWTTVPAMLLALSLLAWGCDMKQKITAPPPAAAGRLVVNEFLASNSSKGTDEFGESDDWIELYNGSNYAIDLAGYGITDDLTKHQKYVIPGGSSATTTIQPKGFLLIWCDSQTDQGPLHTSFNLSAGGEQIGVYDATGETVDELTYAAQNSDVSYGRTPDGGGTWTNFTSPTPGTSNTGGGGGGGKPVISGVTLNPAVPTAGTSVTVSAQITDDGTIGGATLRYAVGGGTFTAVAMTHVGATWSGTIPGQIAGSAVTYYLSATDNDDNVTTLPANAPTATLSYHIAGGTVPVLFVNEFVASNAASLADPSGEYDDWIEIYNPGATPVDLGGMYVTDDLTVHTKWQIPTTDPAASTVPAHGYLLLWADSQPDQGVVHVNFKLSAAGEMIGLYTSGDEVIDEVTFSVQTTDVSAARVPDGSANWVFLTTPTPGATNGPGTVARR
jgi:hypothetical protein